MNSINPAGCEAAAQDSAPRSARAGLMVQFYHLTATPLERALPKIMEKAYAAGFKSLVVAESEERVEQLNQSMWTYHPGSFLPHGSRKDGHAERQPILLSTQIEPLNGANLLAVTSGTTPPKPEQFERILDIFDGNDPPSIEQARLRWKNYKTAGHQVTYMRQTEQGGWEQNPLPLRERVPDPALVAGEGG